MPLIPTPRLVLLALAPAVAGRAMAVDSSLLGPDAGADGALVVLAVLDAMLASGRQVIVTREQPAVLSVGRTNPIRLQLRSTARRRLDVTMTDDRPPEVAVAICRRARRWPRAAVPTSSITVSPSRRGARRAGRPPRALPVAAGAVAAAAAHAAARHIARCTRTSPPCARTSCWRARAAEEPAGARGAPARRRKRIRAAARIRARRRVPQHRLEGDGAARAG
jgi:hypothetical protein